MLLTSSLQSLKYSFHEMDEEHVAQIWTKAQHHNKWKEYFFDIREQGLLVEDKARAVANDVEKALFAGRLK